MYKDEILIPMTNNQWTPFTVVLCKLDFPSRKVALCDKNTEETPKL